MTKPWFKARRYGWGWTPVSVPGWLVVALSIVLILTGAALFLFAVLRGADVALASLLFFLWNVVVAGIVTAIGWAKGEPPRWRWGE